MDQEEAVSSAPVRTAATTRVVPREDRSVTQDHTGDQPRTRIDAERSLRGGLGILLEGYPRSESSADVASCFRCTSVAVMASVDSVLIRHDAFTTSRCEKVRRFRQIVSDDNLLRVVDHALAIRLHDRLPADLEGPTFWQAALRLHLDSLLGLFLPPGSTRPRQLVNLLAGFHYQSVAWKQQASNVARAVIGLNNRQHIERLLLGLALEKDPEVPAIDLRWLAHKAGISVSLGWSEMVDDTVARWRQLSGVVEEMNVGSGV